MVDWTAVRDRFPAAKRYAYLNAAGGSPISENVADEVKRFYDDALEHGDLPWSDWLKRVEVVRGKLAELVNAEADEVAFTLNTSSGMNLVAEILENEGDVLAMEDEFPSSTLPWINRDVCVSFVKPIKGVYEIESISRDISPETKIIVTSHVQYKTGFKQNLEALGRLCKQRDLILVVNATQSIGAFPIDVRKANIDFLVFAALKWPMSGYGIGGIFVAKRWFSKMKYPVAGWKSVKTPYNLENREIDRKMTAVSLEVGAPHFSNVFALEAALDFLKSIGHDQIQDRIIYLNRHLVERLKNLDLEIISPLAPDLRSGIVVIKVGDADRLVEELSQKNIIVSARGKGIRISVHIYNSTEDIDRFVKALKKLL